MSTGILIGTGTFPLLLTIGVTSVTYYYFLSQAARLDMQRMLSLSLSLSIYIYNVIFLCIVCIVYL